MAYLVVHKFRFTDTLTGQVATVQPSKCSEPHVEWYTLMPDA